MLTRVIINFFGNIMFDVDELKTKVLNNYRITKEDALNLVDAPLDMQQMKSANHSVEISLMYAHWSISKMEDAVRIVNSVLSPIIMIQILKSIQSFPRKSLRKKA